MRGFLVAAILTVSLYLVGCTPTKPATFQPDASLMVKCQPLSPTVSQDNGVSMGQLVLEHVELIGLYKECSVRLDGWINTFNEFSKRSK